MEFTIFHKTFSSNSHIQTENGKYQEILCKIMSIIDMNNVMWFKTT